MEPYLGRWRKTSSDNDASIIYEEETCATRPLHPICDNNTWCKSTCTWRALSPSTPFFPPKSTWDFMFLKHPSPFQNKKRSLRFIIKKDFPKISVYHFPLPKSLNKKTSIHTYAHFCIHIQVRTQVHIIQSSDLRCFLYTITCTCTNETITHKLYVHTPIHKET